MKTSIFVHDIEVEHHEYVHTRRCRRCGIQQHKGASESWYGAQWLEPDGTTPCWGPNEPLGALPACSADVRQGMNR